MPLHDVGYRSWTAKKGSAFLRWWVIASVGVRLAIRSTWLSRTLILSWIPAAAVAVGFFAYEQSITRPELRQGLASWVAGASGNAELAITLLHDPTDVRDQVWASLVLLFFRYPQAFVMLVVVGIVAPKLISYDLRNRGYLLYFSRPIRIWEYILGKSLIVWTFLALITTLPALMLYVVGLSMSPEVDVVMLTWDIPLRILAASIVLIVPTTSVALACSAATIESRNAAFGWFALWVVGWVSYSVLSVGDLARQVKASSMAHRGGPEFADYQSKWEIVSPYHCLGRVQQWVFGLYPEGRSIVPYCIVLILVTMVSLWFVHRRLRSRLCQ